jgi:hypothetical protein
MLRRHRTRPLQHMLPRPRLTLMLNRPSRKARRRRPPRVALPLPRQPRRRRLRRQLRNPLLLHRLQPTRLPQRFSRQPPPLCRPRPRPQPLQLKRLSRSMGRLNRRTRHPRPPQLPQRLLHHLRPMPLHDRSSRTMRRLRLPPIRKSRYHLPQPNQPFWLHSGLSFRDRSRHYHQPRLNSRKPPRRLPPHRPLLSPPPLRVWRL